VSVPPWFTLVTPSVLVIDRSAVGVMTVLPSVALLLPAGSFTPTGAAIVAVLEIVPDPLDRRRDGEGRRAAAQQVDRRADVARAARRAGRARARRAGPGRAAELRREVVGDRRPVTALGPAFDATIV
jgi:hypothetical protein